VKLAAVVLLLLCPATATAAPSGWSLSTTKPADAAAAPAYVGNGYVGTRVPAGGAGSVSAPVATETHIAGVYGDVPDPITGGTQRQGSFSVPDWTRLDVVLDGRRFRARDARRYRQELDLRRGVLTTTATWRGARIRYDVLLDRAHKRVGLVRLRVTSRRPVSVRSGVRERVVRTKGTRTTVAMAARVRTARSGRTYEATKVVGFATSLDARRPLATARRAARRAPRTILAENAAAWARLWRADIVVPGNPELQRRIRAAMFYLLASARDDVDWSISPVGLSAGGYNNHVFWDAETWVYPALLAQHPNVASTVVDYRFATRAGAARNARRTGYGGLRFAWESALTGDEVTPAWAETGRLEQHITADVALAQWQHYLATGDREWLRERGWPVIRGAADFWASRAQPGPDGRLHITNTEGPDEQNWPVDDSSYVNGTAVMTLRIAARVAALVGAAPGPRWAEVAANLVVLEPRALDGLPAVRPEFAGYDGQQVKQADVVLLTYPWEFPQPAAVDRSNLDYYTSRYDPDGPAMTDSVSSIVAAQLGGDCSAWTYTLRSLDPFVTAPYEQFTEARSGEGVFTFLTGEGGFLQEFLYGYPGLRWREGTLRLDPTLPPQLARGLRIDGLRWQGRVLDLALRPAGTTVTLRSGAAMTIETPAGPRALAPGAPLTLPTRTAGPLPDNLARCRPARASAEDPSAPAAAAVDGSLVTAWASGADPAKASTLTVQLSGTISRATLTWDESRPLAPYTLQARVGGAWRTVATIHAATGERDEVTFAPVTAESVRVRIPATRQAGENPRLAELSVGQ
jgi:trehalose/maltose hydrolase-like predicted phosphorylase